MEERTAEERTEAGIVTAEGREDPAADAPERANVFGFAPERENGAEGTEGAEAGAPAAEEHAGGAAEREADGRDAGEPVQEEKGGAPEGTEDGPGGQAAGEDAALQAERTASPEEQARRIVDDLLAVHLPDGFDMDAAVNDEAFRQLLVEYPAAAAVRIYQAEQKVKQAPQQVADRLRARQSVPAPTRPTQSVRPEPNYREMSTEDFFRMKERVAKSI